MPHLWNSAANSFLKSLKDRNGVKPGRDFAQLFLAASPDSPYRQQRDEAP
jgi:hypothetical protein